MAWFCITALNDWFHPIRSDINTNRDSLLHVYTFLCALCAKCTWLTGLPVSFVIGQCDNCGSCFTTLSWKVTTCSPFSQNRWNVPETQNSGRRRTSGMARGPWWSQWMGNSPDQRLADNTCFWCWRSFFEQIGKFKVCCCYCGRRGGLMVSALDSGASGPGSSPGRGHCVVFLGKTLYSHSVSLHPSV